MTTPTMNDVRLSDEAIEMLLGEVSAMASARRSLVAGLSAIQDPSLGNLGRAAETVREKIVRGQSPAEAIAALSPKYEAPIRVAMERMAKTGSTEPIHEAIRLIRENNEYRRRARIAAINPILNVLVSATIAFMVLPWILIALAEAELIKTADSPTSRQIVESFAKDFLLAAVSTVVVVIVFSVAIYWATTRWLGSADRFRHHATFCRWLSILIRPSESSDGGLETNLETGRIVEASAEVAGGSFAGAWQPVAKNIRAGASSAKALAFPTDTPAMVGQCVSDLVSGDRDRREIASDLRRLSELYWQKTRRRRGWWVQMFPRCVSWLLMIAIMAVLIQTIISPLLDVFGEVGI